MEKSALSRAMDHQIDFKKCFAYFVMTQSCNDVMLSEVFHYSTALLLSALRIKKIETGLFQYTVWDSLFYTEWVKG